MAKEKGKGKTKSRTRAKTKTKTARDTAPASKTLPTAMTRVKAAARLVGSFLWKRKIGIAIGIVISTVPIPFPRTWATKLNMVPK